MSRAVVVTAAILTLLAGREALASSMSAPPPQAVAPSAGAATRVQTELQSLLAEVKAVTDELKAEQAALQALLRARPPRPAREAGAEAKKKYDADLAAWQQKVAAQQARVDAVRKKLAGLEARLDRLAATSLPEAQRRDVAAMRKQIEQAKKDVKRR
jgi:DNA repair ATPase RecN